MTWLLPSSLSARVSEDSRLACPSHYPEPEWWVTVSGTATQRPSSWRGWKTRPWIRLLSGAAISPDSHAVRSLVESISSRPDSLASRGPSQASETGRTTRDGSGPRSLASFGTYPPGSSSLRTCRGLFPEEDLSLCSVTWPRSGSMRSGRVYALPRLGLHTAGNGCSSWHTPDTGTGGSTRGATAQPYGLQTDAKDWPTPEAHNAKGRSSRADRSDLVSAVSDRGPPAQTETGPGSRSGSGRRTETDKDDSPDFWATPTAANPTGGAREPDGKRGALLKDQVRRLNPNFVDWLMGFEPGWSLARTGFSVWVTQSSRSRQQQLLRFLLDG